MICLAIMLIFKFQWSSSITPLKLNGLFSTDDEITLLSLLLEVL